MDYDHLTNANEPRNALGYGRIDFERKEEPTYSAPIAEPSYADRVKQIADEFIANLSPKEITEAVDMIMGIVREHWRGKVEQAQIKAKELQIHADILFK